MTIKNYFSGLFAALGILLAAGALAAALCSLNASPLLLRTPVGAVRTAEAMLDAVCEGDYAAAGGMMYGSPDLGADRDAADEVGVLIWEAFVDSLSYEIVGSCYATDTGVAMDVELTGLNIGSVTANLGERSMAMLEQRVSEAEDVSEIYDENNDYREDFVMAVLADAAREALAEDAKEDRWEFTLNLVSQEGQWFIMPEQPVIHAISGGIAG